MAKEKQPACLQLTKNNLKRYVLFHIHMTTQSATVYVFDVLFLLFAYVGGVFGIDQRIVCGIGAYFNDVWCIRPLASLLACRFLT